jgi:Phage tail tube protein
MSLAEGVSARIAYKFYASGAITTNALDVPSVAPAATGGQVLRRVASTISLKKATYASNEIRVDRQIADFRHGVGHTEGNITGELSPATYFDFIEAVHRDTRQPPLTLTQAGLTSVAFSATGSTMTFAGGDPVALGLFVGDVVRFTGLTTAAANNATNFTIVSFGGSTNETVTISPAPVIGAADTTFSMLRPGHSTIVPLTGQVPRKMAIETFFEDLGTARLYQENRLTSYKWTLPATGLSTFEATVMGRAASSLTGGAAPFFTAPAAQTTTGVVASVNGALLLGGVKVGVVSGLDFTMTLTGTQADVVGQNFPAEIFLGRADLKGTITAYLTDNTLFDDFENETELGVLVELTSTSAANSPVMTAFMPRVKFSAADLNLTGEAGQMISCPFQALLYSGTTPGVPLTTIRIVDSEA